ncbi:MAG: NUDIX domain-containing protein, partial [Variovorax sp.]
ARIADWLRATGRAGAWRNEQLGVVSVEAGRRLATVERAVVRNLGLHTHSVQLHARSVGDRCWLQQRSFDKATDPGRWDTLSAGLVSADESVMTALHRETWEEAGIRVDEALRMLRACGTFTVRRPVTDSGAHGYLVETVHAFDAVLVEGQSPSNRDGEVIAFETFSDAEIDTMVRSEQLTLEAAVTIVLSRAKT